MIGQTFRILDKYSRAAWIAPVLVALVVAMVGPAARAANDYTVNVSAKELKLKNPTDAAWESWFEGDTGYQRMIERNAPFVEIINGATSTSPITQFHLSIGDNRFNFGPVEGSSLVKLGRTTPGFSLTSSTVGNLGNELIVNIGNGGLKPGDLLRFKINLDVDPSFAAKYSASFGSSQPDFRTVLFDMNGVNVYDGNTVLKDSSDNAWAYAVFNPGGPSLITVFEDPDVEASEFFNNNIRGSCCCVGDPVLIFTPDPIPEPSSIVLVSLGMASVLVARVRRRR